MNDQHSSIIQSPKGRWCQEVQDQEEATSKTGGLLGVHILVYFAHYHPFIISARLPLKSAGGDTRNKTPRRYRGLTDGASYDLAVPGISSREEALDKIDNMT
jgi:hypothetical protein